MKTSFFRFTSLLILLVLVMAMLPVPVYAATITSVVPNKVVNNASTTITVNGTGFLTGSAVVLLNGSALPTTVVNDSVLTATVPSGLPAGLYTVTVSNGVDPDVSCSNCLEVLNPTPVPPTPTPTATTAPLPFVRPQFVIKSSRTNGSVSTNSEFKLIVALDNAGTSAGYSVQAVLSSPELVPLKTGGVVALGTVAAGNKVEFSQSFFGDRQYLWSQHPDG